MLAQQSLKVRNLILWKDLILTTMVMLFAPSMNADEFQEQQQEAISTEAEAFRLRQQQLIRQQQELEADVLIDEAIDDAAEAEAL